MIHIVKPQPHDSGVYGFQICKCIPTNYLYAFSIVVIWGVGGVQDLRRISK